MPKTQLGAKDDTEKGVAAQRGTCTAIMESADEKVLRYDEQYSSIVADVDRVRRRIERNPRHYQRLCDMAREHAAKGSRFSPQLWREFHSDHDLADEQGVNFRVPNEDVAIYARFLIRDVPEARNVVVLRRSKYDPVFEAWTNA